MLKSIKLENFKKLKEFRAELAQGLNIIVGENAAGKSTLTQAIGFALYGSKAVPSRAEDIPTWGEKNCSVTLEVGDHTIYRTLKNCKVFLNDKLVAEGTAPCSDYIIENITNLDFAGFKLFNWSQQGETQGILTIGAMQLQRDVEKFSGIDFLDQVIRLAGADLSHSISILSEAEEIDYSEAKAVLKNLAVQDKTTNKDLVASRNRITEIEQLIRGLEAEVAAARDNERARERLSNNLTVLSSNLDMMRNQNKGNLTRLSALKTEFSAEDYSAAIESVSASLENAKESNRRYRKLRKDFAYAESRIEELAKMYLDSEIAATEEKELEAYLSVAEVEETALIEAAKQHKKALDEAVQSLSTGICQACNRPFSEEETADAQREVDNLNPLHEAAQKALKDFYSCTDVEGIRRDLKKAAKASAHLQRNSEELENCKVIKETLTKQLDEAEETDISGLEEALRELREGKATQDSKRKEISTIKSMLHTDKDIADCELEIAEVEESLTRLPTIADKSDLLRATEAEKYKLQCETRELEKELEEVTQRIESNEKFIKDAEVYNKEIKARKAEAAVLSKFVGYLKSSRVKFLSDVWGMISSTATKVANGSIGITEILKTEKDGFAFAEGDIISPCSAASGAQRGFIGVAVRIAMARVLRVGMPSLILDEPSESMGEANASALAGSLLGQGQILLITHRNSDTVSGANLIEVG